MGTLREWLEEQPFTLAMSSGFFGFFAHAGMLSALLAEGFRPQRVVGSSAGGLVGGAYAGGVEMERLAQRLFSLKRADFWDPRPGLGLLAGERFAALLEEMLLHERFEDCACPLAVSVFEVFGGLGPSWRGGREGRGLRSRLGEGLERRTVVLDQGPLVPALVATCAVPFMFQPVKLEGRSYWDGGVMDRCARAPLGASERVFYHHLSSRSPWRRPSSPALRVPFHPNQLALVFDGLPRCGPFHLERGKVAYRMAFEGLQRALDRRWHEEEEGARVLRIALSE